MRILVVMHSAVTRTVLRRRLVALSVDLAVDIADADEADATVAVRAGAADLVITDGREPARTRKLLAELRSLSPELMLAVALWRPDPALDDVIDASGAVSVHSPFDPESLGLLLARAVALRTGGGHGHTADSPYDEDPPSSFFP